MKIFSTFMETLFRFETFENVSQTPYKLRQAMYEKNREKRFLLLPTISYWAQISIWFYLLMALAEPVYIQTFPGAVFVGFLGTMCCISILATVHFLVAFLFFCFMDGSISKEQESQQTSFD